MTFSGRKNSTHEKERTSGEVPHERDHASHRALENGSNRHTICGAIVSLGDLRIAG
jgi:hypothetical protein